MIPPHRISDPHVSPESNARAASQGRCNNLQRLAFSARVLWTYLRHLLRSPNP